MVKKKLQLPKSLLMHRNLSASSQVKKVNLMKDEDILHSDVLSYFTEEFATLEKRLKTGELDDYRERVLVSRKIGEAVNLLSPYVRSDPRARQLVRTAEALKKQLLSVRDMMVKQLLQQREKQSLLQVILRRKKEAAADSLLS